MVAIPTYHLPLEDSTDRGKDGGGGGGGGGKGSIEGSKNTQINEGLMDNLLGDAENATAISIEDISGPDSVEVTTEVWCPRRGASPEHLRQLQVITLVVIGLIGLLIVSFLLLCMFYKNERLLEKMPWRKRRLKKMKQTGLDISSAINTTLHSVPSIRIAPGALDYLTKNKGKHFPTHKTMLVDIGCRLAASSFQVPRGISPASAKRSDPKMPQVTRGTRLSSGAPDPNNRARCAVNDSMMRRHHNAGYSLGLSDARPRPPDLGESSDDSWYSEGSEASGQEDLGCRSDDEEQGFVAESRRGARGEKGMSLGSKNKYSDQYGSSMAKRGQISEPPVSMPHEVSYMSGRFW